MANANRDRLTGLAPELRRMIAEVTARDDLKSLRQVSKSWRDIATPILFSKLTFRMHTTPEEWSKRVRFEMGVFVKTFTLTTIEYDILSFEEYRNCIEQIHGAGSDVQHSYQHLRQGFAWYLRCRDDHNELLVQQHCLAHLTVLLNSMTTLQRVKLTGDYLAVIWRNRRILEDRHGSLSDCGSVSSTSSCNASTCSESASLALGPDCGLANLGKRHLRVLFSALAVTRSPMSELTVHGFRGDHLRFKAFDIPETYGILAVFSRLTILDLTFYRSFQEEWELSEPATTAEQAIRSLTRALSRAVQLLHLTLKLDSDSDSGATEDLPFVLEGCTLPKLLTCKLWCGAISYTDLADFIRGSPSLSQLTIWGNHTDPDTLHDIHAALRKDLPQLTLEIN
ncbi:MAG: hypothetical protein L6R36_001585 [Xanthoria steineri]|nr:MAG: hypothetical protein L6R36_001585 [Xanthoria steineri]